MKTPSPKAAATKNRSPTTSPAPYSTKSTPPWSASLADKSGAELEDVRQAALIFLYRLLFLLYAEDRDLLPVNDSRYDDYGLRKSVRDDVDQRTAAGDAFSGFASHYYDHISTLCRQVDKGDPTIGLPPYNGGLFAQQAAPLLEQVRLSDARARPNHPQPQPHRRANPAPATSTTAT